MRRLGVISGLSAVVLVLGACSGSDEPSRDGSAASPTSTSSSSPSTSDSPEPAPAETYAALGDSYTAAPGVPETDDDSGCARSSNNYPAQVAQRLDLVLNDVSCTGADTLALLGAQETDSGVIGPQLLAVVPDLQLVTLGMGGNDEGLFRDLVTTCLSVASEDRTGSPCRDAMATPGGGDSAVDRIGVIEDRLASALAGIQGKAPNAVVVLVGYPQLVPAEGTCPELPLAVGDYAYVRSVTERLGAATARAARTAGARYVDVLAASKGHDICAGDDAWVNGIANDDGRPAAPLHPFAEEQAAVADLVIEAFGAGATSAT